MKILAFAASSSRQSINKAFVTHAAERLRADCLPDAQIELIDLNDYEMPIYSIDREREGGIPEAAHRFFAQIGAADALLISYAEHNGSYTAAFKNLFDWTSRIETKVFRGTPMTIFSVSPGRGGGANVLKAALASAPHFGAEAVSSLSIPRFAEAFDAAQGVLRDAALQDALGQALQQLAAHLVAGLAA